MLQGQESSSSKLNHLPIQTIFLSIIFHTLLSSPVLIPRFVLLEQNIEQANHSMDENISRPTLNCSPTKIAEFFCLCMHYYLIFSQCSIWLIQSIIDYFVAKWKNLEFVKVYEIQDIEHFVKYSVLRINIIFHVLNHLSLHLFSEIWN